MKTETALAAASKLREWLRETDRLFIVFDAVDLMAALPPERFPQAVYDLQGLIALYAEHRRASVSSDIPDCARTDMLDIGELRALIAWAERRIEERQKEVTAWKNQTAAR